MQITITNDELHEAVTDLIAVRFGELFTVENVDFILAPAKSGGVRANVTIQPAK